MHLSPRFLRRLSDVLWISGLLGFFVYGFIGMAMAAENTSPPAQYQAECGSCHVAYPARFLRAQTWLAVMAGLDKHFGENAELDSDTQAALTAYLTSNAATKRQYLRGLNDEAHPLRITELPWFQRQHHEIPKRILTNNPGIPSLSQCDSCHGKAAAGKFGERDIRIPGYGRWDD